MNQPKTNILNYTRSAEIYAYHTQVNPDKSIADIKRLVTKYKCKGWMDAHDPKTNDQIIAFQIPTEYGDLTVRFPLKQVFLKGKYLENESYRLLLMEIKTRLALSKLSGFFEAFMSNVQIKGNQLLGDMMKVQLKGLLPEKV